LSGSTTFVDRIRSKIEGAPRKWSFVTVRLVAETSSCREDNWKSGKGKSDELHFVLVVFLVLQKIEMWEKRTTKQEKMKTYDDVRSHIASERHYLWLLGH
jgi:hypothetical protein